MAPYKNSRKQKLQYKKYKGLKEKRSEKKKNKKHSELKEDLEKAIKVTGDVKTKKRNKKNKTMIGCNLYEGVRMNVIFNIAKNFFSLFRECFPADNKLK